MKLLIVCLWLLWTIATRGSDDLYSDEVWLHEGLATQICKFKRITFSPHPEHNGIIAVHCEIYPDWSGRLRVLHQTGDKTDWAATLPPFYWNNCGDYLLSYGWVYLEKQRRWILQVFDSTHRGDGSLWLFALEERELRVLLHTPAVDRHHEHAQYGYPPPPPASSVFRDGRLNVEYRVPEGGEYEAVYLTGTIIGLDDDDKELSHQALRGDLDVGLRQTGVHPGPAVG